MAPATLWTGRRGNAVRTELGTEHHQPAPAEALGDCNRILGALKERGGTVSVEQVPRRVTNHRRELRAGPNQCVDIVIRPIPDLHLESGVGDSPHAFFDGKVEENHLRANGQPRTRRLQCSVLTSTTVRRRKPHPAPRNSADRAQSAQIFVFRRRCTQCPSDAQRLALAMFQV